MKNYDRNVKRTSWFTLKIVEVSMKKFALWLAVLVRCLHCSQKIHVSISSSAVIWKLWVSFPQAWPDFHWFTDTTVCTTNFWQLICNGLVCCLLYKIKFLPT